MVGEDIPKAIGKLPKVLLWGMAAGLFGGIAIGLVVLAFGLRPWLDDWVRDKIPTQSQIVVDTNDLNTATQEQMQTMAGMVSTETFNTYSDSLRDLKEQLTRDVAAPLINTVQDLVIQVNAIQQQIGTTNRKLDDRSKEDGAAERRITESMDALERELKRANIEENMLMLQNQLDSLKNQTKPLRTTRAKM